MGVKEWAELQELLLKSQLKIIQEFLRQGEEPRFKRQKKGPSQISIIYDTLLNSPNPPHITEIIVHAEQDFSTDLNRESIASALSKKVRSRRMFKKVAPNTFAILDSSSEKIS